MISWIALTQGVVSHAGLDDPRFDAKVNMYRDGCHLYFSRYCNEVNDPYYCAVQVGMIAVNDGLLL